MSLLTQDGFPTEAWERYNNNKRAEADRTMLRQRAKNLRIKMYAAKSKGQAYAELQAEKAIIDKHLKRLNQQIKQYYSSWTVNKVTAYRIDPETREVSRSGLKFADGLTVEEIAIL